MSIGREIKSGHVDRQVILQTVIMTTVLSGLVTIATVFVGNLEFTHSVPFKRDSVPWLVERYRDLYQDIWIIPGLVVIMGVWLVCKKSVNVRWIVLYVGLTVNVIVAWMLWTLVAFYLANQSFVFK